MRIGDGVESDIAERRLALADDDRRPVDQDPVDQVLREERRRGGRPALDQKVVDVMKSAHLCRIPKDFPAVDGIAAGQQRAPRRTFLEPGKPHIQLRPVGEIGAVADEDHVAVRPFEMDVPPSVFACDPLALARRQRDLAVDRQSELQCDPGAPELELREPAGERALRRLAFHPQGDVDSSRAETPDSFA